MSFCISVSKVSGSSPFSAVQYAEGSLSLSSSLKLEKSLSESKPVKLGWNSLLTVLRQPTIANLTTFDLMLKTEWDCVLRYVVFLFQFEPSALRPPCLYLINMITGQKTMPASATTSRIFSFTQRTAISQPPQLVAQYKAISSFFFLWESQHNY